MSWAFDEGDDDVSEPTTSVERLAEVMEFVRDRYPVTVDAIEAEVREDLARQVAALPYTFAAHTCWDDHEGEGGSHADGSPCHDKPRESVSRTAVIRLLQAPDPLEGGEA